MIENGEAMDMVFKCTFKTKHVKMYRLAESRDTVIEIRTVRKKYWLFGPLVSEDVAYRGDCTVWHNADTGHRASTMMESWLCDRWTQFNWKLEEVATL
jgi:hypothetical protein